VVDCGCAHGVPDGNWAGFILLGETAVAPGSRSVMGDAAPYAPDKLQASAFAFPLPPNIHDLNEEPDPFFSGAVSKIDYQTPLTVTELLNFYKRELEKRGLTEVKALENVDAQGFSLVYRGLWGDREVVVGATDSGKLAPNTRSVGLGFEHLRGADIDLPPAVNEKRAGLPIPPHAIGVNVATKFDPSARVGDITFLSKMTSQELIDFYRPIFSRMAFTGYPAREKKDGEKITLEFHSPTEGRALLLHIEKSSSDPERREVQIHF
jgi:hypothetical protein